MKQLILIFITLMLFSCSKEQEKLELFSEEAFAFYLEESWELNASARVKGFTQLEDDMMIITMTKLKKRFLLN
jgi:hypothetical protein